MSAPFPVGDNPQGGQTERPPTSPPLGLLSNEHLLIERSEEKPTVLGVWAAGMEVHLPPPCPSSSLALTLRSDPALCHEACSPAVPAQARL